MKRLVVGLLLAASALAPMAAQAQRRDAGMRERINDDGSVGRPERAERQPDRAERQQRRAERQAARADAQPAVQAPIAPQAARPDRPRRDRDGDGQPDRRPRDRADATTDPMTIDRNRPDRVRRLEDRSGRADRGPGRQRLERREDSADFADYATDPRNARRNRIDDRDGRRLDDRRNDGRQFDGRGFDGRRDDRFQDRGFGVNRGGQVWNRGWRNDDRFDWNRNRLRNRAAYRLPRYYAPQGGGFGYRRFSIGVGLSRSLFGQNYWLDDPYAYRLPPAYGPYRWVRYYDDALLVDLRTGRVIDAVYGIFY